MRQLGRTALNQDLQQQPVPPAVGRARHRKPLSCTLSAAHTCTAGLRPCCPLAPWLALHTAGWLFPNLALEVDLSFLFQVLFNCTSFYYKRATELNEFPDLAG